MLETFNQILASINGVLWHPFVLYALVGVGVLFTVMTGFCQYRALVHGTQIVSGKYDSPDHPGAISHFQALSAALSATVGVGNIGGTALAITLGGPGAVFWMWVVGFLGMALKTTEVTLSMLFRDTSDPRNPRGGPMWVARRAMGAKGEAGKRWGKIVGGLFCVTLLISTFTGGNFFQAWNAGNVTRMFFGVPELVVGCVMAVLVAAVILGGIRRIGLVAGSIVPFMCGVYLLAALWVLFSHLDALPAMLGTIVRAALNPLEAEGAFLGGTAGLAFSIGLQRGLFSNESGQGSSPIAHAAARTDKPVREGVVAGLEPFIDTLVVCTLTALVILLSGAWNRAPDAAFVDSPAVISVEPGTWSLEPATVAAREDGEWQDGDWVFALLSLPALGKASPGDTDGAAADPPRVAITGAVQVDDGGTARVRWTPVTTPAQPELLEGGLYVNYGGAALTAYAFDQTTKGLGKWLVTLATWLFALSTLISWSYYGEQAMHYFGSSVGVLIYKIAFCIAIPLACSGIVRSQTELNNLSNLGTGVMLFVNVPLTLAYAGLATGAYRRYFRELKEEEAA